MSKRKRPVILIVDDEEENLDLLERTLMFDYEIHRASSGEEALAVLEDLPDLAMVITDQRMPGMTGTQLLGRVAGKRAEAVRVIITGYTSPDDLIEAINSSNVYRFLTKPWDVDNLLAVVRRAVRLNQAGVGGLVHDITGLPGRGRLLRELERELIRASQLGYTLGVERICVVGFPEYEAQVGSARAEDALRQVADALAQDLPPLDFLAALEGGVFVRLLCGIAQDAPSLEPLCEKLTGFFRGSSTQEQGLPRVEISRVDFPADGSSAADLLEALGLSALLSKAPSRHAR